MSKTFQTRSGRVEYDSVTFCVRVIFVHSTLTEFDCDSLTKLICCFINFLVAAAIVAAIVVCAEI